MLTTNLSKIIRFWGICDFAYITWYILWSILNMRLPFVSAFKLAIETSDSFGLQVPIYMAVIWLILFVSIAYSGWLLYNRQQLSATVCYLQTPFRLFLFQPSLFFISWPWKYLLDSPSTILSVTLAVTLLLISESLKIATLVIWRRSTKAHALPLEHMA